HRRHPGALPPVRRPERGEGAVRQGELSGFVSRPGNRHPMTRSHALLVALAGWHLFLVLCGAAGLGLLPPATYPGQALRLYRALSGADTRYGFFAPSVDSQLRVTFTLTDASGRRWTDELDSDSPEVRLQTHRVATELFYNEARAE